MNLRMLIVMIGMAVLAPAANAVDFAADIQPIFNANCVGCHGEMNPAGGLRLDSEAAAIKGSARHTVLTPGSPGESRLIELVKSKTKPKMPPDPLLPLVDSEIEAIEKWIASLDARAPEKPGAQTESQTRPPADSAPPAVVDERAAVQDEFFESDVSPILASNCLGCHSGERPAARLDLSRVETIARGAGRGERKHQVVIWGKPDESRLIAMVTGDKPHMPPKPMMPLSSENIETLRQWIARTSPPQLSGSSLENAAVTPVESNSAAPEASPAQTERKAAPVDSSESLEIASLAFHPQKPLLAVGRLHQVDLYWIDPKTKRLEFVQSLPGHSHLVRALCFSPDGSMLAAAGGQPGVKGEIVLWDAKDWKKLRTIEGHGDCVYGAVFSPDGKTLVTCSYDRLIKTWNPASGEETASLKDHVDAVYGVAMSPDGKRLASVAGDRTVKVWDAVSGKRAYTLSEPLKAQYAVAFTPDGTRLAAAGDDKIIRVWKLGESNGELEESKFSHDGAVLQLFYSKNGDTLFSTAEDRLVKAWNTEDFVERRVWGPFPDWVFAMASDVDETYLACGCYDGSLHLYDRASGELLDSRGLKEKKIAAAITEPAEPHEKSAEVEPASATSDSTPESAKDSGDPFRVKVVEGGGTYLSALSGLDPKTFERGKTHTIKIYGKNLQDAVIMTDSKSIEAKVVHVEEKEPPKFTRAEFTTAAEIVDTGRPYELTVELAIDAGAPPGAHALWARTPLATSNGLTYAVEAGEAVAEKEDNDDSSQAQLVSVPALIAGTMNKAGDVDSYRFEAKAGDELVFDVMASALGSGLDSVIDVLSDQGERVASSEDLPPRRDARMGVRFDRDGTYVAQIRDANLRGGGFYRLHIDAKPLLTRVFPLGARHGDDAELEIEGYNLDGKTTLTVTAPEDGAQRANWRPYSFSKGSPLDAPRLAVGDWPEYQENGDNDSIENAMPVQAPCVVNGRIMPAQAGSPDVDWFRFAAKKGETLAIAVEAQQLGSPLDSFIDIRDAGGKQIEIATVRCVAETFLTLSDRDSRSAGIRLDSWTDLRINDYVMIGSEILRVERLPDYPDEDVAFYNNARFGWRYGLFGTTTSHHAVYTPAYKVEIHPPGSSFPPNGLPLTHLYAENDDGGAPVYRKDSYFEFHPPADGDYYVSIRDTMDQGGVDYAYRLHIRPPHPDFTVFIDNSRPNITRGGRFPLRVTIDRMEGFDGEVRARFAKLPEGVHATEVVIPPAEESASLTLWADPGAKSTELGETFPLEARAEIGGETVMKTTSIDLVSVVREADVSIVQTPEVLSVRPGEAVDCTVKIERRHGFSGRVPIDVRNLPLGVYVMDTGLNGILVREDETERTYRIYVEPWVKPMELSFFSIAIVETASPLPHWSASNSSALKILPAAQTTALKTE
ncbi:MAG: hypothetical protein GC154_09505 [bacterium]|nr:hypothetical protein [bacterium]